MLPTYATSRAPSYYNNMVTEEVGSTRNRPSPLGFAPTPQQSPAYVSEYGNMM
jgi:hypothetical protein